MAQPCQFGGYARGIICQTEVLTAEVPCLDAEYLWTPSNSTLDNDPLRHSTTMQVDVECVECGVSSSATYCFPVIEGQCDVGFHFDCAVGGIETLVTTDSFLEFYVCGGDFIDWSTVEFNTDHLPAGAIVCTYNGVSPAQSISVDVDHTKILPGSYYIPVRVSSDAGIKSNWTLMNIYIERGCCPS